MADSKVTALTALTGANVATGDPLMLVDISDTTMDATGTNKKITADELAIALATTLGLVGRDKIFDAKGDIVAGTAADTAARKAVGANGTILAADSAQATGLAWQSGRSYLVDEVHADAGSASSNAEQTLATLALPGGVMAAGDMLRFTASGDQINTSGSNVTYTWRFKIGSTTLFATSAFSVASVATNRRKWYIDCPIVFAATNAQRAGGLLGVGAGTAQSWEIGSTATPGLGLFLGYGTASEDSASALNVILTCQLGTSVSTADVILHSASLTLVKK